MFIPGTSFMMGLKENWFFWISPNAFGAVGALVNFSVTFFVNKFTGDAPLEIQQMVENFREPHGVIAAASNH